MSRTIRKNISLREEDYKIISEHAIKKGISFSEMLWSSAIQRINQAEEMDLLSFLKESCDFVSKEEQKEFEKMNIDLSDLSGEEISLNELLQD